MECTQRLECTQDLYDTPVEKTCPEQIGFLGICGTKYPVKIGPNKVGRDPQTCSIVLQLESISRQHAVINVLNQKEFMLMDLDSANKTKLSGKTLQPYIPHALSDGDLVQFGKTFGVFRLLRQHAALAATQALLDQSLSAPTTVPESPDVSDRDDSFIAPSQPQLQKQFKDETSHFFKPSAKTISIQPIGSKKIDNVYWNSKRSTSIGSTLFDSTKSMNDSAILLNKSNEMNLHEMETQAPMENIQNISVDSIYTANTQMPNQCYQIANAEAIYNAQTPIAHKLNISVDSIYTAHTQLPDGCSSKIHTADTQIPNKCNASPSIYNADTQMPAPDNLPIVCKVPNQHEMQFDLFVGNKENDNNLFNAETQAFVPNVSMTSESLSKAIKNSNTSKDNSKSRLHTSEEEILFEDIDKDCFQDEFESQSLLPESPQKIKENNKGVEDDSDFEITLNKAAKRTIRIKSSSSTDCEDFEITPVQQLLTKPDDDDITDCEDSFSDDFKKPDNLQKSKENFEDILTQVIVHEEPSKNNNNNNTKTKITTRSPKVPFEDMLTQVIQEEKTLSTAAANDLNFEEMPTQVICDEKELLEKHNLEDLPTQILHENICDKVKGLKVISNEFVSPFKVPLKSPRKLKRKDTSISNQWKEVSPVEGNSKKVTKVIENDDNYYEATQDILDDLCTQAQLSPEILPVRPKDDDVIPSSVEDYEAGDIKLPGLDYEISPKSSDSNIEEKLNQFVTSLSKEQIQYVIGVQPLKKQPSDPSDSEATPKKVHPMKLFEMDLPNSQEIKTSVSLHYHSKVTETSSESETENESTEDQFTPILFRKKRKPKIDAKLDLTKKLDVGALPSRVSTRVRKPAAKIQENDTKRNDNFLKPKYLTEQEGDISNEIIIENITRLKTKNEKNKSNTEVSNASHKSNTDSYAPSKSLNKTELNSKDRQKSDKFKESTTKDIRKTPELKNEPTTKGKRKSDDVKQDSSVPKLSKIETLNSNVINIDLTGERSKRSTRNKPKETSKCKEKATKNTEFSVKDKKDEDKRRHRSKKEDKHEDHTKEVRRSRRQKSYKEKKENDSLIKVKIGRPARKQVKEIQEKSAVYSVSSESGAESPRRRKRPAVAALRGSSPKRTRASARSTPASLLPKQKVLFTAFPFDEVKNKLESLGAEIVSDVTQCTVVVTAHIKRTFKLLCALGLGRPIVGSAWLQACHDNNHIVDPWLYLLKDEQAEQRFKFSLQRTLTGRRGFLRGYNVSSTPQVKPATAEMMLIVECSGGTWAEGGSRWLCVSCSGDRALWPALQRRGARVVSSELVLGGVLRQELDVEGARLA
ncbi:uncharacterized protein LOC128674116 isoform X2 [Plodia interpunctella]|uniref:uncharacterized protein LOC128674116 isoform X2 n=1 Tax=Plodia interpunctella TaxID=58824 RepID=UPI00236761A3|nr:uncharacterized protein LOC128674116 isoform X2 [Plodia interpunctella]